MVLTPKAASAAPESGGGPMPSVRAPVFQAINIVDKADAFKLAMQLPAYRMPALNYPVYRLLHRLQDTSLMAILTLRNGASPIFIAALDPLQQPLELAITHTLRPQMSWLVDVLRKNLKIETATVLSVRETAEGLAQEWQRDRQHQARIHGEQWTYYHVKEAKPRHVALPTGLKLEHIIVPQANRPNPATQFALLTNDVERQAAIGIQKLPGANRILLGDIEPDGFEGETAGISPLFNRMLRIAKLKKQRVDFILGNDRPSLRAELLGKHLYNCDARYSRITLGAAGADVK